MSNVDSKSMVMKTPAKLCSQEAHIYLQNGAALVDIRPEYEINYRVFDVPSVYVLSYSTYTENFHEIPKDKRLIIADSVGLKSPEVAAFLVKQGYAQVGYLIGGIVEWERNGLPVTKDLGYELQGACACMLKPKKL